jgi:hypothetical protein
MRIVSRAKPFAPLAAAITLAGGAGFLTSQALGVGSQGPARTVTIDVAGPGPQGPAGPPGPPGEGITVRGSVPTVADLPQTGNTKGDTYIVEADGSIQVWDGSKWVQSGSITAGSIGCPAGYEAGALVINAPGGHVQIWTCLKD